MLGSNDITLAHFVTVNSYRTLLEVKVTPLMYTEKALLKSRYKRVHIDSVSKETATNHYTRR